MQHVDLEFLPPCILIILDRERRHIRDNDIDAAHRLRARRNPAFKRSLVTDINRLSEYSHTLGLQRRRRLVNALLVARTKSDMRSVRRKIISAAPANALAAAGDEYA